MSSKYSFWSANRKLALYANVLLVMSSFVYIAMDFKEFSSDSVSSNAFKFCGLRWDKPSIESRYERTPGLFGFFGKLNGTGDIEEKDHLLEIIFFYTFGMSVVYLFTMWPNIYGSFVSCALISSFFYYDYLSDKEASGLYLYLKFINLGLSLTSFLLHLLWKWNDSRYKTK